MNKDDITNFMILLRSDARKCPRCNNTTHTKECDFGDFRVVDDLSALYVDPSFAKDGFDDTYFGFLKERSARKYYLDCLCYVLTNDVLYKQLDTNEKEMVSIFNRSTSYWRTWRKVSNFLRKNKVMKDTSDPLLRDKITRSVRALELFARVKSGEIGEYETNAVTERQKTMAYLMIYVMNQKLRSL